MLWRLFHRSKIARYHHNDQPWALVTGSSDGIGKGIATELLGKGFAVLIHGRNPEKLAKVRDELKAAQGEKAVVEFVVADVSRVDNVNSIVEAVQGKNLTVLVNNAGYVGSGGSVDLLTKQSLDEVTFGIDAGVRWITLLTKALLPILQQNRPSLIINIGSLTAVEPPPYLAVYSGGKGYVLSFTQSLRVEMKAAGFQDVTVQYHEIHNVATTANGDPENLITPSPARMGKAIINAVGKSGGTVTSYWAHEMVNWILAILPQSLVESMIASQMKKRVQEEQK